VKVHRHEEQFDGGMHAWCGRGDTAVLPEQFEATPQALRCAICDRDWFPRGQPDWHYRQAVANWKPANAKLTGAEQAPLAERPR
jgi:hypothetical protein